MGDNETIKEIPIKTEFIKLEALLKFVGAYSTGGEAKLAIQSGEVLVNGGPCDQRGKKLHTGDLIACPAGTYRIT